MSGAKGCAYVSPLYVEYSAYAYGTTIATSNFDYSCVGGQGGHTMASVVCSPWVFTSLSSIETLAQVLQCLSVDMVRCLYNNCLVAHCVNTCTLLY